jgi:hypothetical protein
MWSSMDDIIKMGRKYDYYIIYNDVTTKIQDPIGWEEQGLSFTRNESLTCIREFSVPLEFVGNGYSLLKEIFTQEGYGADNVFIKIERRNDNFEYEDFYYGKIDFKTYEDNFTGIKVDISEVGLAPLIDSFQDQNYEIRLASPYSYLKYDSFKKLSKNILQLGVNSKLKETYGGGGYGHYLLPGDRAVRDFTDSLIFVKDNGDPFGSMKFKCVKDTTVNIKIKIKIDIDYNNPLIKDINYGDERILLRKTHGTDPESRRDILNLTGSVYYKSNFAVKWKGAIKFESEELDFSIPMIEGDYLELFLRGDSASFLYPRKYGINAGDSFETHIEIYSETFGEYKKDIICIGIKSYAETLLHRITNGTPYNPKFEMQWDVDLPFDILLSSSDGIRQENEFLYIRGNFKDLVSFLRCNGIYYNIEGNKITFMNIEKMFKKEVFRQIDKFNSFKILSDTTHCYNSFNAGSKTESSNKENGIKEFNCENTFSLRVNLGETKKLDLVSPYICGMYDIEKFMNDVYNTASNDNENDTKIFAFAVNPNYSTHFEKDRWYNRNVIVYRYILDRRLDNTYNHSGFYDVKTAFNIPFSPMRMLLRNKPYIAISQHINERPIIYASTSCHSKVKSKMLYEETYINEQGSIEVSEPIFFPIKIQFKTSDKLKNLSIFENGNTSRMYELYYKGVKYNGYISEITTNQGVYSEESYELLQKEI